MVSDLPPALTKTTSSDIIRKNLDTLHSARSNYIKNESAERIRRALRHKTRTYVNVAYERGDSVYYRRAGKKGWRGPARVIGHDHKVVLVRHGAAFYRRHPCHLMKVNADLNTGKKKVPSRHATSTSALRADENDDESSSSSSDEDDNDDDNEDDNDDDDEDDNDNDDDNEDDNDDDDDDENDGNDNDNNNDDDNDNVNDNDDVDYDAGGGADQEDGGGNEGENGDGDPAIDTPEAYDTPEGGENDLEHVPVDESEVAVDVHDETNAARPAPNEYIQYSLQDGSNGRATVLSAQPKRSGKWGDWLNVYLDGASEPSSLNWRNVVAWKRLPSPETVVLLSSAGKLSQKVLDAKQKEIDNLKENNVFDVVADHGQRRISTKWVITEKIKNNEKITKARLVARGFEENLENTRTDSPTCSRMSLRLCFAVAATMSWGIQSFDVTSAFLQGNCIEKEVYVKPPPEWNEGGDLLWKLRRCLYGLNDAPRAWYDRVVQIIVKFGGKASRYDSALFLWHERDCLIGMTAVHVDDFVYCGTTIWNGDVIEKVYEVLKIGASARGSFKYIGLEVCEINDGILLEQHKYVEELEPVVINAARAKQRGELLNKEEKSLLRSISGKLLWAATQDTSRLCL